MEQTFLQLIFIYQWKCKWYKESHTKKKKEEIYFWVQLNVKKYKNLSVFKGEFWLYVETSTPHQIH